MRRINPQSLVAGLLALVAVIGLADPVAAEQTRRSKQWYLDYLRISEVHRLSTGRGVLVAVVDTGVDSHPDLAGRVIPGARSDGFSGDGRTDEDGHGTHMAGIIAATGASRDGTLGVAPGAKILPIRTNRKKSELSRSAAALGIRRAADLGAKVINASFGGAGVDAGEAEAVAYALSKDAVVVGSAGNVAQTGTEIMSPANIPGVIAVTGHDQRGNFWTGSAHGPAAVVSAPAVDIYNTLNSVDGQPSYGMASGTSDATAIVSGIAALIRAKYPNLDAPNVINRIIRTAQDAGPVGRDTQYGFGRIDPLAALTANVPAVSANPLLESVTPTAPSVATESNEPIDLSKYNDGGLTDRQVMIIGIGLAVVLVVLLVVGIWLAIHWGRRRAPRVIDQRHPPSSQGPVGSGLPLGGS